MSHKRHHMEAFHDLTDDTFESSDAESYDDSATGHRTRRESERIASPKCALNVHPMFTPPAKKGREQHHKEDHDPMGEKRVTIWNWREKRKLSGNSAPFKKNLHEYLRKHPDWEQYVGQDKDENGKKSMQPKKRRKTDHIQEEAHEAAPVQASRQSARQAEAASKAHEAEVMWKRAKEEAARQKELEETEASRWREFSAIQHIIDHYTQGPSKSPFIPRENYLMMNA